MDLKDKKYNQFALCREMFETVDVISSFNQEISKKYITYLQMVSKILITGEGSSRLFPGKNLKDTFLKKGINSQIIVEGATQSLEYDLSKYCIFGVSNSGRTSELVTLFNQLDIQNHPCFFGLTTSADSPVAKIPTFSTVLNCGNEEAVAATKSVVAQALFFESLQYNLQNEVMPELGMLASQVKTTLELPIDKTIIDVLSNAPVIYFAGRNNGVAEELALKTNEITRKKSVYLEGTYALHGIEEVMQPGEVLVLIDPFLNEEPKFKDVLVKGAGISIVAISPNASIFPAISIPQNQYYQNYLELVAGWNLLVETGLNLTINLDKPVRARKIGNEI